MPPPGKKTGKSSIAEMKERQREVVSGPTGGSGSVANTGSKDFGAGGEDRPPPSSIMGTGSITQTQEFRNFLKDTGRNERNPYGNEGSGIFGALSRKFPGLVTYDNILSPQQIALQNRLAFDRYKNPFAERNILGKETGADMGAGRPRYGVQPGMRVQTPDGRVVTAQAKPLSGIAGAAAAIPYLGGIINFLAPKPAEIPGFEADNPMDTGANLGEDRQNILESAINKLRDTFSQPSSEVIPVQEAAPTQNVEPVRPTAAEAILSGPSDFNEIIRQHALQGPPELTQDVTQGFNQINVKTGLDFPGDINDYNSRLRQSTIGVAGKTAEQLQKEAIDRGFDTYNYMER